MKKFQSVQVTRPKRNAFDLSHEKKLSCNMGELIPIYLEEIVPGDKFKVSSEILLRFAPLISPVMHRINVFTHYFFVPNRLTFSGWEDFITGGEDGTDNTTFPTVACSSFWWQYFGNGSLADYFGIPTVSAEPTNYVPLSALPFRAYQLIYNEYYRDQNLEEPVQVDIGTTVPAADRILTIRQRAWEKDYFTSALPWAQRGGEVGIPVDFNYLDTSMVVNTDGSTHAGIANLQQTDQNELQTVETSQIKPARVENLEEEGVSVSINELRKASRLQEWLEKNARAGSRYIEQILSHFGVRSSDARLQRPEYLGGGKTPVVISEVLQTGQTSSDDNNPLGANSPQGNMAGHGIAIGRTNTFSKSFEEHGYVIGIMSILPRTAYQQGYDRMWLKYDKFDYYWPEFAHLGEQEIKKEELWFDFDAPQGTYGEAWGYQERYAEYKYRQSQVSGDFRDTLKFWHMGRIFTEEPVLSKEFVMADPDPRIFAVTDETDKLYVQIYNKVNALRPMPYFGTPRL